MEQKFGRVRIAFDIIMPIKGNESVEDSVTRQLEALIEELGLPALVRTGEVDEIEMLTEEQIDKFILETYDGTITNLMSIAEGWQEDNAISAEKAKELIRRFTK